MWLSVSLTRGVAGGQGGADEFHPSCWLEDAKLKAWATSQGIDSAEALLDFFHIKWQKLLLDAGRRPQFWCAVKTRPDPTLASPERPQGLDGAPDHSS